MTVAHPASFEPNPPMAHLRGKFGAEVVFKIHLFQFPLFTFFGFFKR